MGSRNTNRPAVRGLLAVLCLCIIIAALGTAGAGVQATAEYNGLSQNESLSLFSRDVDGDKDAQPPVYGPLTADSDAQEALQRFDSGDREYDLPPERAPTWTENAFDQIPTGDFSRDSSIHPSGASLNQGRFIKDAHLTIFSITPSTVAHESSGTTRYIGADGAVRALGDYRVAVPETTVSDGASSDVISKTVTWSVQSAGHDDLTLYVDGQQAASSSSRAAALRYELGDLDVDELTVDTTFRVTLEKKTTIKRRVDIDNENSDNRETAVEAATPNGTDTEGSDVETVTRTELVSESVDVRAQTTAEAYDLSDIEAVVGIENGTGRRLVLDTETPVSSYAVSREDAEDPVVVQTHWQFFTARDTTWDRLKTSTAGGTETTSRMAVPVGIHAYPSQEGLKTSEQDIAGARKLRAHGTNREPPSIPENVQVDVRDRSYSAHTGFSARHPTVDTSERIQIHGIVRNQNMTRSWADIPQREVHPVDLSMTVVSGNSDQTTLRVTLRDETTGEPLPVDSTKTVVTVVHGGKHKDVDVGEDGTGTVTFSSFGGFSAHYEPLPWTAGDTDVAYSRDQAFAREAGVSSPSSWVGMALAIVEQFWWLFLPVYLAKKTGKALGGNNEG